ncbi:MAG: hypothetical protein B0D92_01880 [Spirochaeta sp. LUC14_002_19_P3]|nr:MAG: hypothetical protein B0D92_01880 [Spirochaeta sp. LUC14_002_19_P3]
MEVERLSLLHARLEPKQNKRKDTLKSKRASSAGFADILKKTSDETLISAELSGMELPPLNGSETLEDLLDEVHIAGGQLKQDASLSYLNSYKTAVRRFMHYVIEKSIEVNEIAGIRNPKTMRQKNYTLLKIVDEKLESLAAHILKNQTDQLSILQRVDEINGLLVDIAR